jgi:hypothetical protein
MSTSHSVTPFEPSYERRELVRLVRRIQALTVELEELRRNAETGLEVQTKERLLDQLHWRLAAVARRTASGDLGNAA